MEWEGHTISDPVVIALIVAVPGTIAAIGSLLVSLRTWSRMSGVEKSVDGVKDELVMVTRQSAFAAGVKHEKDNPS